MLEMSEHICFIEAANPQAGISTIGHPDIIQAYWIELKSQKPRN
jgi:hypothetical protein